MYIAFNMPSPKITPNRHFLNDIFKELHIYITKSVGKIGINAHPIITNHSFPFNVPFIFFMLSGYFFKKNKSNPKYLAK